MARITEDLIRRRAEHNRCEITTLEELSLHQQDIERIEHLDKWCRDLRILYLQSNLIPKIENVGRLKRLEYLNLALNNIERIENLEGCESLEKLDLTVNFVGELTSIESLRKNERLRELFLTGNPCTEYDGYRAYVVATLPQLQWLDGKEIEKSERILALQELESKRRRVVKLQSEHADKREAEKAKTVKKGPGFDGRWYTDQDAHLPLGDDEPEDDDEKLWTEPTAYTPESRLETHKYLAEKRKEGEQQAKSRDPPKRETRLQTEDGRRLNMNQGKLDFSLTEVDCGNSVLLDISVPKFLDSSLIDCDVQPTYVKCVMKGKILQLTLPEEISPDQSTAKRSQTTGHLVLTMPKVNQIVKPSARRPPEKKTVVPREVPKVNHVKSLHDDSSDKTIQSQTESPPFIDDPDVPPLI
eukprot:m.61113 g.61113  ORF g.61113 m.61113 type:complete len:414 (+) comp34972_c0_seq16:2310-3551(+)